MNTTLFAIVDLVKENHNHVTHRSHGGEHNKSFSRKESIVTLNIKQILYAGPKSVRNISTNLSPNAARLTSLVRSECKSEYNGPELTQGICGTL